MSDWKYFTEKEMACTHCGECHMDDHFMAMLDSLREAFGGSINISSGYRCPEHPIEARKEKAGAHSTGKAADILCSGEPAHKVLLIAAGMGFTGIGVNQKGGSGRFIHLDICDKDDDLYRPTVWSY